MRPSSATTAAADAVDVILRDGTTLRLRAPAEEDADALVAFFAGLSDRSRYLRFHGIRQVDRTLVEPLLDPDWAERGALVGTFADGTERADRRRRRTTTACAIPPRPRSRSSSRTSCRGEESERGCSSSSRRELRPPGSATSSPR